ncbi:hypothetical protein GGF45_005318 [Coemansia sp. RSA 551]|nr:hypothetical protein GGF45_005318 [Coemansia sp. RSA 551]
MGTSSAQMFHSFDHQSRQHGQTQQSQSSHDGHLDYQAQQQYHQHHSGPPQQPSHSASTLGYVNGGQAYHHSQQGMDNLEGSTMSASDSLGLLSPPAVTWSSNM